jgi:seryl-tRNA synthetase
MTKSVDAITKQLDKLSSERKRLQKRLGTLNTKEDRLIWDLKRYSKSQKNTSSLCQHNQLSKKVDNNA